MNRRGVLAGIISIASLVMIVFLLLPRRPADVDVSLQTLHVDDVNRSYRVALPRHRSEPIPIVFAFHGIGDSADSMAAYSQLDWLAAEHGFLLVYPEARNHMWATIDVAPHTLDANPDVRFFDRLLAKLSRQYAIDPDRVYVVGMSNGASFTQLLAHARSSEIAAVVACAGTRPPALPASETPFPVLLMVGSDDSAVTAIERDHEAYQSAGNASKLIIVHGLGHQWPTRHNETMWEFMVRSGV